MPTSYNRRDGEKPSLGNHTCAAIAQWLSAGKAAAGTPAAGVARKQQKGRRNAGLFRQI